MVHTTKKMTLEVVDSDKFALAEGCRMFALVVVVEFGTFAAVVEIPTFGALVGVVAIDS